MFDEISEAFNMCGKDVIFAWGGVIYNPSGLAIPPELIEHERVHCHRQGKDVEGWWRRYIDDPAFRLAEEIPAHHAEYMHLIQSGNRNQRRRALKTVAGRLASPLYGRMISAEASKRVVKDGTLSYAQAVKEAARIAKFCKT